MMYEEVCPYCRYYINKEDFDEHLRNCKFRDDKGNTSGSDQMKCPECKSEMVLNENKWYVCTNYMCSHMMKKIKENYMFRNLKLRWSWYFYIRRCNKIRKGESS